MKETQDVIHAAGLCGPGWVRGAEARRCPEGDGRLYRLWRSAAQGRRGHRLEPAPACERRDACAGRERQGLRAQRTLCRDERTARRLLPDRGARSCRGQRLGFALPECGVGHAGSAAGLDNVMAEGDALAREAAETAARSCYGKLIAFLAARTRDVAGAEDALSEAFAVV